MISHFFIAPLKKRRQDTRLGGEYKLPKLVLYGECKLPELKINGEQSLPVTPKIHRT